MEKKTNENTNDLENEIPLTAIVNNKHIEQTKTIAAKNRCQNEFKTNPELSIDMKYVCRICLMAENNMISLMSTVGCDLLADIFTSISSIKVSSDESLPLQICASCQGDILHCYNFKLKCNKTNNILRSLLKEKCNSNISSYDTGPSDKVDQKTLAMFNDVRQINHMQHNEIRIIKEETFFKEEEEDVKKEINEDHEEIEYLEDDIFYDNDADNNEGDRRSEERLELADRKKNVNQKSFTAKKKRFNCNKCFKNFLKSKTLRTHIQQCHSSKTITPFACGQCKDSFNSQEDLHIHSALHVKGNHWTCNKCFKDFTERNRFRRHIRRHMETKRYPCETCDKTFSELCALRRHARVHTGEKVEKKYRCDICDKRFCDSSQLAAHSARHTGVRPCACECGKAFPSRRLLASHRLVHSDLKRFACDYCDKRFRHESTRNTHHRTHTGEKPYICSICGKTFIQSSNLKLHMRTHTGERPYTCDVCGRKFTSGSSLTCHRRTHTGEKPYSCHICGKRFARTDIRTHMRQHTGERPFACFVCPKKFINAARLRDHYLIHTGEKPYECAICNEKFKKKSYLAKHLRSHDKEKKVKQKKIVIVQQLPFVMDNNLIYAENGTNDIAIKETTESNVDNEYENKEVTLVTEEVPLEVSGELVLQDDSNVKADLVVVNVGHNNINYEEGDICLNTNNINFENDPNTHNGSLVTVNEGEMNISESTSVLEGSAVKLYQLDQSLVQIHTSGRHITIQKITSKMTTNFN
ncbi:zinc finger protein 436-like isoform X2 [Nymphalis io]|uniref:zinc finger protein 436-like isoform X2 n=1 Tax=Inachis io TaxID=171585 RepID=UPI002167A841|nr:zinc finger protein 436-like isoform X2 [Nymphalis io]